MSLTKRRIERAQPNGKLQILWDTGTKGVKGLGLRITKKGVKAFILSYRVNGKERRITLGRESNTSLEKMRDKAGEMLMAIRAGHDPLEEKRATKEAPTVKDGLDRFFGEFAPQKMKDGEYQPKTINEYRKQSKRYIEPYLGKLRIADVKRGDVEKMTDSIKAPVQRNRVLSLASKLFNCFERWDWRQQRTNPCFGIDRVREEARDRVLSESELAELSKILKKFKRKNSVAVIRILMLTGLRVSEVLGMKWEHVNFETGRLLLPKTKTGRRQTDLPEAALTILNEVPRVSDYCFSTRQGKPTSYKSIYRHFNEVTDEAGIKGVTPHDLRRSFMTHAAKSGVDVLILRDLLGHRSSRVAERYVRGLGEPVREARQKMGERMASMLDVEGGEGEGG